MNTVKHKYACRIKKGQMVCLNDRGEVFPVFPSILQKAELLIGTIRRAFKKIQNV